MARAYYNEHDPKAAAWLRELIRRGLIAPGDVDERSISDVLPSELSGYTQCHFFAGIGGWSLALRLTGWLDDRPVWTGSCPCQPFSTAGEGKGVADERHLWPDFKWLIQQCRPPVVFGEQVASEAGREWFLGVRVDLEGMAYEVGGADLCAACVGAPHPRQRVYWSAFAFSQRQSQPWQHRQNPRSYTKALTGSADGLVSAVRRNALPFLCREHDGVPTRLAEIAHTGYGNAIVPQVAAEFIQAAEEAVSGRGFDLADLI